MNLSGYTLTHKKLNHIYHSWCNFIKILAQTSWKSIRGKIFQRQINIICTSVIWPVAEICIKRLSKITNKFNENNILNIKKIVFKIAYTCDKSHKNFEQSTVQNLDNDNFYIGMLHQLVLFLITQSLNMF